MAASDAAGLPILRLQPDDAEAVWPLSVEAGWNQIAADWRLMIASGSALGIKNAAGRWMPPLGPCRGAQMWDQHGAGHRAGGAKAAAPPAALHRFIEAPAARGLDPRFRPPTTCRWSSATLPPLDGVAGRIRNARCAPAASPSGRSRASFAMVPATSPRSGLERAGAEISSRAQPLAHLAIAAMAASPLQPRPRRHGDPTANRGREPGHRPALLNRAAT